MRACSNGHQSVLKVLRPDVLLDVLLLHRPWNCSCRLPTIC